jgi:nucleotide-binding universal stress UspA family protein
VNTQPPAIKRIVVGVDGSEPSAAALAWAITMASGMGCEIVAVYAIDYPVDLSLGFGPPAAAQYDPEWRAEIKRTFEEEWCAPLRQSGLPYRVMLEDGRPASVIVGAADSVDADVVVMGRRGRGGVAELLLGSASHEVALQSKRPVLLI